MGVPAYNGGLFGDDPQLQPDGALIAGLKLRNDVMGDVLTGLLVDETKEGTRGPVDFRSLDVRAFGTIYEGLLEAGLSVADVDLAVDATGSWRPAKEGEAVLTRAGQAYFHTQSGSRKATGSYFTKPFAVEHLLDRALDPTLDEHLARVGALLDAGDQAGAAHQFFDFRVADLAMGSGHFLVAAIGHIEAKFGAFLETHPIPGVERELLDLRQAAGDALSRVGVEAEIDRSALLGRQIARRCIYGLDINDIAVELARLAIWVRTFVPGLPMSSLDHQLVCGDSLTGIGQVEEAVEALDPGAASSANLSFTGQAISTALRAAKVLLEDAAELKEASTEETRAAQQAAQAALRAAEPARLLFDAALAVRLGLQPVPADFDPVAIGRSAAGPAVQTALARLAPIHFPVRFPEVFLRPGEGFDVLIGNPPWEKLHVKEDVWWSLRFPGVMSLPVAERDARIVSIAASRPDLVSALEAEKQHDEAQKRAISSAPFPGLGAAHIDLFAAFAWRNWQLTRSGGRIGVVLPRTAFGGSSLSEWRLAVLRGGAMDDICFLTNTGRWVFAEVHPQYTVALSVIRRAPVGVVRFSGPFHSDREFHSRQDQPFSVPVDAFVTWSGTYAFPFLPTPESGAIFLQMRRHPRFDSEDGFAFRPVQGDLNITTQRDIFVVGPQPRGSDIPVVAGATFGLWNPDHGAPYGWAGDDAIRWLLARAKKGTSSARSPYLGMEVRFVDDLAMSRARIVLRQIARPTDARTTITCLQPPRRIMASGAHYLHRRRGTAADEALVLAIMASVPFDWYAPPWVELNFTFELLNPMPVPRPSVGNPMRERLVALGGRLAAVDDRFRLWANEVGVPVGGLLGGARDDAIAEIDALVAHLYGLSRSQLQHVFETFHRGWDYSDRLARVLAHYDRWASAS